MADPLRIGVEVDASQLGTLASASTEVAESNQALAEAFAASTEQAGNLVKKLMEQGVSAKEAAGALTQLGYTAKEAAAAMQQLGLAEKEAGDEAEKTAVKVTMMERAMAAGDIRVVSSIAGLGGLGSAFARVGAASSSLAPVLAAAFPVIAVIAFIDIVGRAVEAYDKWITLGEETVHKTDDVTLSLQHESDQLDVVNARLQNQIDKLEKKPENYMALFLAEDKVRADQLAKSLEDVIQKQVTILKAGPGGASAFFLDKGNVAAVGKLIEPLERELQLAAMAGDKEAQHNVLLKEKAILIHAAFEESQQQQQVLESFDPGESPMVIGREPDQDALLTYQSMLKGVQIQLDDMGKSEKTSEEERQLAILKNAADQEKAAKKYQELVDKNKENAIRGAREEATAVARGIKEWQELEDKARRALELDDKRIAEESKKDARESMDAWQRAAEARIKSEEEAFHVQQQSSENRMKDIKAQESLSTAGLNKGPITNVIEAASLREQGAVAAQAMQQAQEAAKGYASELDIVKSVMAEVNQNSDEGRQQFKDLEKQMEQLQHLMDSAAGAAQRWGTTLDQIKAKQKELGAEMGFSWANIKTSMENSIQAGFTSFNSAFTRMLAGGMSFTRVMQTLWTSMVDTFVTSILRMAEEWVTQHLIMIAIQKIFGATGTAATTANTAAQEAERQVAIGTAAAEAAASTAAAGPGAAIAAAAIVEGALQGITAPKFAQGGIVRADLHEGEMVLPKNISTFIQTAAGAAGAPGGMGGPGGRGGPGGSGNVMHNRVHLEVHNHGGEMDESQLAKMVTKELRRMNVT